MAPTEQPNVVRLSRDHVAGTMELSREAGWNQLPADWLLFMTHGEVFGLIRDGELAATAAIMPYGEHIAWIGMVLTRKCRRGRGLGTMLLKTCIQAIESRHRTAVLDATPAGEPIYRALGFEPVCRLTRWQGLGQGEPSSHVDSDPQIAIAAVNIAFGADRTPLLQDFASRCPTARLSAAGGSAHLFGRDGLLATQIGPAVGGSETDVADLVEVAIRSLGGRVFLDVLDDSALPERLEALGFTQQRPFLRMKKGNATVPGGTSVIAGPEFG